MIPLQVVSSRALVALEETSPASLMYTTRWLESQSNSLRRRCLSYPALPFYGIPIMSTPSFEKLSAPRALWAFNSNRLRCGSPAILMEHSRLHRARVRRPSSFSALGLYFEIGSESGILPKRTSSSSLDGRAGCWTLERFCPTGPILLTCFAELRPTSTRSSKAPGHQTCPCSSPLLLS